MLKQGEILEGKYSVEQFLFESQTTKYYLAFKTVGSIPVIISVCEYRDSDEVEDRLTELNSVNQYLDTGILKIIECFRKDLKLYTVQEAPKGKSIKEKIFSNGSFEGKTALKISIELVDMAAGLFSRWPRRLIDDFSIDRVYISENKHVELLAADQIKLMTELGKIGEKECIREIGLAMYQMTSGVADVSPLRQNTNYTQEMPLTLSGEKKKYSEVIRRCINAEYTQTKNPFKQISKDLRQAKLFDRFFDFSKAENSTRTLVSAGETGDKGRDETENYYTQNVNKIESDTVRLDLEENESQQVKKKSEYASRFIIVRNDIWIHTRETI